MVKTTVYLPEHLKRRIEEMAADGGSSEAAVIREALERHTSQRPIRPTPTIGYFESDELVGSRVDELLKEGYGDHRRERPRRGR